MFGREEKKFISGHVKLKILGGHTGGFSIKQLKMCVSRVQERSRLFI